MSSKSIHLLIQDDYKVGDRQPPNAGYLAWHEWAEVQYKGGLRQTQCGRCGLWRFPQDMSTHIDRCEAKTSKGRPVTIASAVCLPCVETEQEKHLSNGQP